MAARAYYNEIDPYAAQWLRNLIAAGHIAPGDVDERSIADVRAADLVGYTQCHFFAGIGVWSYALRLAGWPDEREVWTGSCPCQPFSVSGKRAGFADERHLWPAWFRLITERRPVAVFGEQVESKDGRAWLDAVQADMEARAYAFGAVGLCAAGVGAPHGRPRLFFVADAERGTTERHGLDVGAATRGSEGAAHERQWIRPDARDGGMADAASPRSARGEVGGIDSRNAGGEAGRRGEPQRSGEVEHVGDTDRARRSERDGLGLVQLETVGAPARQTADGRGAVSGFWSDAEWIWCRPERASKPWTLRPVEPGSFPLAASAPGRVGRLRAYGNSIVATVAEAFIEAYMSTLG